MADGGVRRRGGAERLRNYGFVKFYQRLEYHENTPPMSRQLHEALRDRVSKGETEGWLKYEEFRKGLQTAKPVAIRNLLEIKSDRSPIDIEKVEPVEAIMKRFATGGMSLGALSQEAHETLAIGVNRAGARSPRARAARTRALEADHRRRRRGHSPTFPHLRACRTATSPSRRSSRWRGALRRDAGVPDVGGADRDPGGAGGEARRGQPAPRREGEPVHREIRACKEGVMLISPPPHHDIYSIEDLAQLIYDLHQIAPKAKVSVKLVGQVGIGTVASGVAKADAGVIQIRHDGGTGASPLTSIKHAGGPWGLGLAESHHALVRTTCASASSSASTAASRRGST